MALSRVESLPTALMIASRSFLVNPEGAGFGESGIFGILRDVRTEGARIRSAFLMDAIFLDTVLG